MNEARFMIDPYESTPDCLVIRDRGPWNVYLTITNDAENVVRRLIKSGHLTPGRRLLYYDSYENLDEILIRNGRFAGFAPH